MAKHFPMAPIGRKKKRFSAVNHPCRAFHGVAVLIQPLSVLHFRWCVWTIWCHSTLLCAKPKADDGQGKLLHEHNLF